MPLKIYGYRKPSADFWTKVFEKDTSYKPDEYFLSIILEYILGKKILDGGCGPGHLVAYLSSLGYDTIGIDFSKTLIKRTKVPKNTALHVGDITHLPYKENTFDSYISLGVFEHFEEGPQLPLTEANTVLKEGGTLIVTVPYYNLLRRLKRLFLARYHYLGQSDKKVFFEYAFTKKEITEYVEDAGFKVVKSVPISPLKTLELEVVGMKALSDILLRMRAHKKDNYCRKVSIRSNILLDLFEKFVRSEIFRHVFSHMILIIAQKR